MRTIDRLFFVARIIFKMLYKSTLQVLIVGTLDEEPVIKHLLKVCQGYA